MFFLFFQNVFSQTSSSTSLKPRFMPRILMRKYAFTSTAYKFLDIRIVVRSISHVQIVIGEATTCSSRGVQISRLMQSTVSSSSSIQNLNVELVKIYMIRII